MVETRGLMKMFGANGKSMCIRSNAKPFDKKGES
jgi:hypothetical protein